MENKVTITLTLDYSVAQRVLALIKDSQNQSEVPTANDLYKPYQSTVNHVKAPTDAEMTQQHTTILQSNNIPVVVKPTAGKKTSMPSFGRSQAQIDAFAKAEAERVEARTEEEEEREQRAADRAAKKAIKDQEEAEKAFHAKKLADEVAAIKAAEVTTSTPTMPKKPWEQKG